MMTHAFEIRSIPDEKKRGRLFLIQLPLRTKYMAEVAEPVTVARLDGAALDVATEHLQPLLASADVSGDALAELLTSDRSLPIAEETAIRLGLVFNAVNALRSGAKIETAIQRAAEMPAEEAVFWLRKIVNDRSPTETHRRALVMILTE